MTTATEQLRPGTSADRPSWRRLRPRFTLGWMMVAVAVAGVACGVEACIRRQKFLAARSNLHTVKELYYRHRGQQNLLLAIGLKRVAEHPAEFRPRIRRRAPISEAKILEMQRVGEADAVAARYHAEMREKYTRAARHPWLPVAPDPPAPR